MFGAFSFGQPYFAEGPGPLSSAVLAASATLSVSGTAALTKPAAVLVAAAGLRVTSTAALTKPAATFTSASTLAVRVLAAPLFKPPATLTAAAGIAVRVTATLTRGAAQLTADATVAFRVTASLTAPLLVDKSCGHPLAIDDVAPVLVGCSVGSFPLDPAVVSAVCAAPPPAVLRRSAHDARVPADDACATALPIAPDSVYACPDALPIAPDSVYACATALPMAPD